MILSSILTALSIRTQIFVLVVSLFISPQQARNVTLFLTRVHLHPSVATSLSRSGIITNVIGLGRVFDSLEEADRVLDLSLGAGPSTTTSHVAGGRASEITPGSYFPGIRGHGHTPLTQASSSVLWNAPDSWLMDESGHAIYGRDYPVVGSPSSDYFSAVAGATPQIGGQAGQSHVLGDGSGRTFPHGGHDF
jgi:hypothetical protein